MIGFLFDGLIAVLPGKALVVLGIALLYLAVIGGIIYVIFIR